MAFWEASSKSEVTRVWSEVASGGAIVVVLLIVADSSSADEVDVVVDVKFGDCLRFEVDVGELARAISFLALALLFLFFHTQADVENRQQAPELVPMAISQRRFGVLPQERSARRAKP